MYNYIINMIMISINFARRWAFAFLSLLAVISFSACSSDEDAIEEGEGGENAEEFSPYVASLAIQGSEGGFTYYTVPFEDIMSGTLSAAGQGIEQPGYYDFTQIDNTIYSLGGLDDVNVVAITKDEEDRSLEQTGDVSFSNSLSDLVVGSENTLVSVTMSSASDVIVFKKFNASTVEVTETVEVPVSDITDLTGPAYSGMRVSGDHLFLSYYISDPDTYATDYTDQAEVAVFSYPGLEFQKVITDERVGPIGGFNVKSGLIKDEAGNIYAISHSNPANGFSQSTKPSGILKISSGETEFDQDYFFDIEEATGGYNTAHLKYLGGGKAFAEINMADRSEQAAWSDNPLKSAVIDLEAQTVDFIDGIPQHKGDGRRLAALQEDSFIYLSIPEGDGIYVYKIDTENYTATRGAKVEANFVAGLFKL